MNEADLGKARVHAVRDSFRRGLYEVLSTYRYVQMFTATWSPLVMSHEPTPVFLNKRIQTLARHAHVNGVFLVETSRLGRQHVHGFVASDDPRDTRAVTFRMLVDQQLGICQYDPITDLLGAINYVTKTFGPETEYTWRLYHGDSRRRSRNKQSDQSYLHWKARQTLQGSGLQAYSQADPPQDNAEDKQVLLAGNTGVNTLQQEFS